MTTFYVNYATGSDTNSGTSPNSPWKHAPGDPNATGAVKTEALVGGDEVLFKAGVVYQGTINMQTSGTAGKPIVYEGTGWGTGKAIMSGLTSAQLTFTADPSNPKLSVATLPAGLIPAGMSTETQSALNNIVEIDGKVSYMSNNSTSSNPYFPDLGAISYSASEMKGSGSSWTLTDPSLGASLSTSTASTISNMVARAYVISNNELNMSVTGYNSATGALSLSGKFVAPSTAPSVTLYNNPAFVSSSDPYSEYALEGNQIIAAVTPGVHTVAVSASPRAFYAGNKSNITVDGFDISGYGDGDGRGIVFGNAQNIQITNNTLSNLATHDGFGFSAIAASGITNLTISGNTVGPNITYGGGIADLGGTNSTVSDNTINSPGWSGIVEFDDVNSSVSSNRITNAYGVHATGIIAFDVNGAQESQNVSITNNQIQNGGAGIAIEGNPTLTGPVATPNNFTIAYNVITGQTGVGIADWGNTNTANIYGNIVLTSTLAPSLGALHLANSSKNISFYDNILQEYTYLGSNNTADTFVNNVSLRTNDPNLPKSAGDTGNTADPGLAAILQQALATPGVLPASIGSILRPGDGPIGIDWSTSGINVILGAAISEAKNGLSTSANSLSPSSLLSLSPTLVATSVNVGHGGTTSLNVGHGGNGGA